MDSAFTSSISRSRAGTFWLNLIATMIVAAGFQGRASADPVSSSNYFKTSFQTESQFIVETVVRDLAEQIYYAAKHKLPESNYFSVVATERPGSPIDAPVFDLNIQLESGAKLPKQELNFSGPIWSPEIYGGLAKTLARACGLALTTTNKTESLDILSDLLDGKADTIETTDLALSAALEKNFNNPGLHEEAALLLGTFLLRDCSGCFFEIRSPLCRMTAHLAMSRLLGGGDSPGTEGKLAGAILLTLIEDESLALKELKSINTTDPAVGSLIRALQTRSTGDFRLLGNMAVRSEIESLAWFSVAANYTSTTATWNKLDEAHQNTIDFIRAANEQNFSVQMGHQLSENAVKLEFEEICSVYKLSHQKTLGELQMVGVLNEMPERCFSTGAGGAVHVRVIGWGQWADFLQRHVCHAVQKTFYFLNYAWGVPDDAKAFAAESDRRFGGLRLYPFVRKMDSSDVQSYHLAMDAAVKVTMAAPQLVPAECWNNLCYKMYFTPVYMPTPNPHINEWHSHSPPPGTVYDLGPRLNQPSLVEGPGTLARFEKLHALAPYDVRLSNFIINKKYQDRPTYDQAMSFYQDMLPWSCYALRAVANSVSDQPAKYEELMLRAAALDPKTFYTLGDYEGRLKQEDKAAKYYDEAAAKDPDAVCVSGYAEWRVRYYLKKGETEKAREIADFAGEVYSAAGLSAKAAFMELTSNYDGAFEWLAKLEERYNDSWPLIDFCQSYRARTSETKFDSELKSRVGKLFPGGMEKVSRASFETAPRDGVEIQADNELTKSAGLKKGDVIVAIGGTRVHFVKQYMYIRDFQTDPELQLIVWQAGAFNEIKSSPPGHRFGVTFNDYKPKEAGTKKP